jgi:DNA-binding CsgD family transcriptional regulator
MRNPVGRHAGPSYDRRVLFGRVAELASVTQLLRNARLSHGGALQISGEAGMGKSALLDAAEVSADDMLVLRTRGVEVDSQIPFAGLFDLFRPIFPVIEELPPAQRLSLQGALGLGPPLSADRFAIATGTLALLSAAADRRPVLATVDDAQWLDAPSRDALIFAARRLHLDAIAFLWAVRDNIDQHSGSGFPELRLRPLDDVAARQLLEARLSRPVHTTAFRQLMTATGGNPLALIEVTRDLSEAQLTGREPLPAALPLGMSAVQVLRRRVEALDEDSTTVLLLLTLDPSGDAAVLQRAASFIQVDYGTALERLERESLIRLEFARPLLTHPLVRGAVEAVVDPARLRAAHRALADALTGRPDPTARAWHLAAAATEPVEEVASAMEEAARFAEGRSAYGSAARALERAAGLTPEHPRRAVRLLMAATAARLAGSSEEARRLLAQAAECADTSEASALVDCERARVELFYGDVRYAQQLMLSAASVLRVTDRSAAASIVGQAAFTALFAGDLSQAAQLAQAAQELEGPESSDPIIGLTLGVSLLHQGEIAAGFGNLLTAAELTERLRHRLDPDQVVFAALALTWVGEFGRARDLLSGLLGRAREEGAFGALCPVLYGAAYIEARTGHLIRAYALATEGLSVAEATANNFWRYFSLCCLAYIEAAQVREDESRAHADLALEIARQHGFGYPAPVLDALGLLELALGRPDEAVAYLRASNIRGGTDQPTFARLSGPDLVEAHVRAGHRLPPSLLDEVRAVSGDERFPGAAAVAWRCRGLLAPEEEIDACFTSALRLHQCVDNPFALARTELSYGERLRRAERRQDARHHLERAVELLTELGAGHWVTRGDAELRASGAGEEPAREGLAALTPQELQVTLTVAQGKTNREAGAILYVSPKTVEFHLSQVYRKMGVRSRAELAAQVARLERVEPGFAAVAGIPVGATSRPLR